MAPMAGSDEKNIPLASIPFGLDVATICHREEENFHPVPTSQPPKKTTVFCTKTSGSIKSLNAGSGINRFCKCKIINVVGPSIWLVGSDDGGVSLR